MNPKGYCRFCDKEVRAVKTEIGGHVYWICEECSEFLADVSWEVRRDA